MNRRSLFAMLAAVPLAGAPAPLPRFVPFFREATSPRRGEMSDMDIYLKMSEFAVNSCEEFRRTGLPGPVFCSLRFEGDDRETWQVSTVGAFIDGPVVSLT